MSIFLLLFGVFQGYLLGWAGHREWAAIRELRQKIRDMENR